jgi:hypothetical protein
MERYMVRLVKTESGKPMIYPKNLGSFRGSSPYSAISNYRNEEAMPYKRNRLDAVLLEEEKTSAYRDHTVYTGIVLTKDQAKELLEATKIANQ